MARFDIIDAKTGSVKYSGAPRYNGTYCKVSYLEFSEICSDSLISWNIGDYIVYPRTGLTYRLFDIPQPKKRSYRSEYGGAYVYSNVQFFADTKWLEIEPFRDIVPADNKIHFTTQSSWSVWTNVDGLIARLNAVMQAAHPDEWEFRLVNASEGSELYKLLHNEYLDFTVSGESVLDGLGKIYDSFGNIGWIHSVEDGKNIITVGIPPIYQDIGDFTEVYRYGSGRGLTEIRKSVTNKNELKTRLYAYGSTRNMIPRYYNELTPAIKDADSVNIPNLMLPLSKWGMTNGKRDASKAFIERNVSKYGLRPDTVYFDGSDGNKDIYPSIEDTTIGDLYDAMTEGEAYRPDLVKHNRSVRLDAIESVSGIVDDGIESDSGAKYVDTILIPVSANSGDYNENFEISLFSGVQAPMSGKVTIPLSGITIIGTSELAPYYLSYRATITVAGRNYVTDIYNPELSASIKFSLEDVEVECSEGDEISATLSCVRDNSAPATHIEINQATLAAGIASKKDNSIVITIPQIGFDISTRAALGSQGIATISMKDGMCGGRSFVVKSCAYFESTDSWELTLYRGRDESLGMLFPNTTYPISAGDHFVLLDIAMPDTYIGMAEQRLLAAANELLESVSEQKPFYELSVDAKYMIENNRTLLEGRYMRLSDTDMISDVEYVLIDTVVINESESSIPTYRVTLREQKRVSYSNSQSSGDSLTSLASGGGLIESGLTPKQKKILSCFDIDEEGDIYTKSDENGRARGLYSYSFVSSAGKSDTQGTGGGTVVGATVGGVDVELINGVLKFDAYPTTTSLGLKSLAFEDSLAVADIVGLQSALDGKQNVISDLATIREGASLGKIAHSWGNHASAGYALASDLTAHTGNSTIHITAAERTAWNNKYDKPASGIPYVDLADGVKSALDKAHEHANKTSVLDKLKWNEDKNAIYIGDENNRINFFVYGGVASGGFSDAGGVGGGTVTGIKIGAGDIITPVNGILNIPDYPTTTSLGLKSLAFKDSLSVSEVVGLQSALSNKQDAATAITTSNYNSYAPKLDGTGASGTWGINISGNAAKANILAKTFSENINYAAFANELKLIRDNDDWKANGFPRQYVSGLSVMTNYTGWQLVTYGNISIPNPYFRSFGDDGRRSEWKQLAFLTDNVASASKWSTARTITLAGSVTGSVSIDGSANVTLATTTNHTHTFDSLTSKPTTISGYGITDALTTSNYNSYAPKLDGTGASGTWGINISGNAATATNADTLDGAHYQNILERSESGTSFSGTATGWFRIAESLSKDSYGITFLLAIQRAYYNVNNESYLFSISITYSGRISITQLSGYANSRLITKIRIDWTREQKVYVDLYIDTSTDTNLYSWYTIGCAKSYTNWIANPTLVGMAYEFTTVNGCKSDKGFTAVGNILATGAVTAGQASDARLKSNIVTARNACGILRSLRGVEFDWNSVATENCKDLTGHDVGLIAQEVESLIPSAIGTIWGEYKRLDYTKITPYLVEGWKAHDEEIQRLKTKIKQLEERIYGMGR